MSEKIFSNPEKMAANWRIAMSALANQHLAMHHIFAAPNGLNPTELLIYLTITVANVQKLMRERSVPDQFSAKAVLPREWVVPISRHAIATASGLPRETVRRHVTRMIENGLLIEDERGGVTPPPGMIDTQGLEPLLAGLLTEFGRTAETLLRIGVIEVKPG